MTTTQSTTKLFAELEAAHAQQTPELALDKAMAVYLEAKRQMVTLAALQDACKDLIADVMLETNTTVAHAAGGTVEYIGATKVVYFNAAGLDTLGETFPEFAAAMAPHRKVTAKKGYYRINADGAAA